VLCALGALTGGERREASRSVLLSADDAPALERAFRALERRVRAGFDDQSRGVRLERHAELRYRGQAHALSVAGAPLATLAGRFHRAHERRFGFADGARAIEVVTLDVRGERAAGTPSVAARGPRRGVPARTIVRADGHPRSAAVWRRDALATGASLSGPAIVLDEGATFWLPARWRARVHPDGALVATRSAR